VQKWQVFRRKRAVVRAGAVKIPNEGIPAVDEAESPVVRRGSAARGVSDEAVAEAPGPSRVPAFVLPASLACWHDWQLRWRPARKAPVRKTVAPLWHPHVKPSQSIGTPGRARQACALILWTEECAPPKIRQEDVNPPLAGRKGVAVLTSGRSSGGGGPSSSVGKGRHSRHRRVACDLHGACAGLTKRGQESHRACAPCRHSGNDFRVDTRYGVLPHRQPPVTRCARLPFPPGRPSSSVA
ncbi:hypothetical protein TcCL_ESM09192, partial [Trypanosoma cruzi]